MKHTTAILPLALILALGTSFAYAQTTRVTETTTTTRVVPVTPVTPVTPTTTVTEVVTMTPVTPATPPVSSEAMDPMVEADVRALLTSEGFRDINDVHFKEGTWTADATSADGNHVELRIDSATRRIYSDEPVATLSRDEIIIRVQTAGYTNVHDVDMEGGVWKAEANDSAGNDVELKIDPADGRIIGSEKDVIGQRR